MTAIYKILTALDFFTMAKSTFIIWIILFLVEFTILVGTSVYLLYLRVSANKFYNGQSPNDERVKKFALIICAKESIFRILLACCGILVVITIGTFCLANFNLMLAIIVQTLFTGAATILCMLRVAGERDFCYSM